jgi:hypothetical protein
MFELLITSSLLLSILIAVLSFPASEEKKMIASLQEELTILEQTKEEEALRAARVFSREKAVLEEEVGTIKREVLEWHARYDALETLVAIQREELNTLRVDHHQLSLLLEHPAPPKVIEVVKIDPRDVQLRLQFEEKSEILHETRKSLFLVENEFLALQRENQESFFTDSAEEIALMHQLSETENTCAALEAEIATLHSVVATLIAPKKTPKRKKEELLQTSLFV